MRQQWMIFCLLCFPILTWADDVKFESSLVAAKQKAAAEGKLILLDFTAGWCTPCRIMEEHTFPDSRVQDYFKSSYVPVKIDIDDFDGFALKQTFKVEVLPTIIFLNSKGEFIARHEESLSASRLVGFMKDYDKPSNKQKTTSGTPTTSAPPVTRPALPQEPTTSTAPSTSTPSAPISVQSLESVTGEGLFRFSVTPQSSKGFSIQIGVFSQYENVLTQVAKFQRKYPSRDILVNINRLNDRVVYKVLIGLFSELKNASSFKKDLLKDGMDNCFVINLKRYR